MNESKKDDEVNNKRKSRSKRSRSESNKFLKREVKANVFFDLFHVKRYQLELFRALHPEDTSITETDLTDVTCRSILADTLYNDLGFFVRDKLLILVEAQSTWSRAIVVRLFLYLASTFLQRDFFEKKVRPFIYRDKELDFPEVELYVIYTGKRKAGMPKELTWRKDVVPDRPGTWDFSVKVLYDGAPGDIINQYVSFCKYSDKLCSKYGYTVETARMIINGCIERGILPDYLRSIEVETMLNLLRGPYEQELIFRGMLADEREEGKEEGIAIGERKNSIAIARDFLKDGDVPLAVIAKNTRLTLAEVEALARGEEIE